MTKQLFLSYVKLLPTVTNHLNLDQNQQNRSPDLGVPQNRPGKRSNWTDEETKLGGLHRWRGIRQLRVDRRRRVGNNVTILTLGQVESAAVLGSEPLDVWPLIQDMSSAQSQHSRHRLLTHPLSFSQLVMGYLAVLCYRRHHGGVNQSQAGMR